jgi:hypothetical protein
MANERIPNDPYRSDSRDDDFGRAARLDNELQPDHELQEGPASTSRVALFALAVALVLGAVFYGLNNSTINHAGTTPPAQTAQQTQPAAPAAPPGMRDVTPRSNSEPGTTTGSATNRPTAPASNPSGTEIDRSANPSAGK